MEACPRCGGKARVESDSRSNDGRRLSASMRCESCGSRFRSGGRTGAVRPLRTHPTRGGGGLVLVPFVLLASWILLRALPYSERAQLYSGVASLLESFQSPLWAALLSVLAVFLVVRRRRARPGTFASTPVVSDVHVREESGGSLALLLPDSSGARGRDYIVARKPDEETRLRSHLAELAARSVAFLSASTTVPGSDEARDLHREIYSAGLSVADALLGDSGELRERLFELRGEHLLLKLTPGLAGLPWELIVPRAGAQFLWQQYHVARQVRDDSPAGGTPSPVRGALRLLLLADLESSTPGRSLPAAEAEAAELMELGALDPENLRVVRRSPRTADELKMAFAEGFDVVHFAGHTLDAHGNAGWVLGNGEAVDPSDLVGRSAPPPFLVFANACRSGPGADVSERSRGAASRIMTAGVAAFVGTLWELEDARAAHFSRVFYRSVLSGASLGEAMSAARESQMGISPFTWANYVLYGDPAARLLGRE
ncbi:MAG: CHAT domain-containing protein [Candidatus Eisenbacteria bacterium]